MYVYYICFIQIANHSPLAFMYNEPVNTAKPAKNTNGVFPTIQEIGECFDLPLQSEESLFPKLIGQGTRFIFLFDIYLQINI